MSRRRKPSQAETDDTLALTELRRAIERLRSIDQKMREQLKQASGKGLTNKERDALARKVTGLMKRFISRGDRLSRLQAATRATKLASRQRH